MTTSPTLAVDNLREDTTLLARTMAPYARKETIYLKNAVTRRQGDTVTSIGDFGFQQSCYIEETGHFNAVEFVISYNQLVYYTLAATVRDHLLPELKNWDLEDYWQRQLPSILISRMSTRFRQPINARNYHGELTITDIEFRQRSRPLLALQTKIDFTDDAIGNAQGDVEIVLLDLPAESQ
ncbi:FcoT family thioesterase [Mycolicibacterium sp. Y3]